MEELIFVIEHKPEYKGKNENEKITNLFITKERN
jgi:hypothetical protein